MTSSFSWILVGAVGILSVLGQLSLGRNTILASLRIERLKAYSDFLASANKAVRMTEDIVALSKEKKRASNIIKISGLKIQVEGFLIEMDRAFVLMQLTSPAHLVKLGERLRSGIDARGIAVISEEDLETYLRNFILVAKRDLKHPIWTKIRGWLG